MVTEAEEIQAKEFLKRAEVRTMKKDLMALREVDALTERDKIANLKTLEEQLEEKIKADKSASIKTASEKAGMEEVLQKNEGQERIAEKDLKKYAKEEERQQIFLFESQRLGFEKQTEIIDKEKDPALKLKKNELLLIKREHEAKLNVILEQEKKLETEQKFIAEKEQVTTIPAERKSLEQSRWDLDKRIQDMEKKRWAAEKELEGTDNAIILIDKSSEQLVIEKNGLEDKIFGVDKLLREIYSVIMAREEERIRGEARDQIARREAMEKQRATENEKAQRKQWSGNSNSKNPLENKASLNNVPVPIKRKLARSFEAENEQRKKFMQDVDQATQIPGKQGQQKTNIN